MKKHLSLLLIFSALGFFILKCDSTNPDVDPGISSVTLFNGILFYDGYAETVDEPVPDGIIRVKNSRYVTKIPASFLTGVKNKLNMEVIVRAACDNYDRIGSVYLSLLNKNESYDETKIVHRIEIARFITPFMDKNKSPEEVPYTCDISNISKLLKDQEYSGKYDFWIELDIFGVPYAANQQISGCAGKNYTFFGTLILESFDATAELKSQYLKPVSCYALLNNYSATDEIGKTVRSFTVDVDAGISNAKLYLITSNHGANAGGEEYNRRDHYVYFDNGLLGVYKPGGLSCEPFRIYNTQSNGIYGSTPRSDAEWASFSNWCPGDVIPTRVFEIGAVSSGTHTFKIEVPDAKFVGKQGEIPVSVYIQGDKN